MEEHRRRYPVTAAEQQARSDQPLANAVHLAADALARAIEHAEAAGLSCKVRDGRLLMATDTPRLQVDVARVIPYTTAFA